MDPEDAPSSVRQFLRALCARWFVAMSGPLAVPLGIAAVFVDNGLAKLGLAATALICLTFSAYWVWSIEREKVRSLQVRVRQDEVQAKHTAAIEAQTGELRRSNELRETEANPTMRVILEERAQSIRDAIARKRHQAPQAVPPALSVSLLRYGEYQTEEPLPDGRIRNGAYVVVRNIGSVKMHDIKVYMERSEERAFRGNDILPLFGGSIEIDSYEQHFVRVAYRDETADEFDLNREGGWIMLCCPANFGEQRTSQYGTYLRLKVICPDCDPVQLTVRLSVSDSGRLNITEAR
jgi:hypothetical protein